MSYFNDNSYFYIYFPFESEHQVCQFSFLLKIVIFGIQRPMISFRIPTLFLFVTSGSSEELRPSMSWILSKIDHILRIENNLSTLIYVTKKFQILSAYLYQIYSKCRRYGYILFIVHCLHYRHINMTLCGFSNDILKDYFCSKNS